MKHVTNEEISAYLENDLPEDAQSAVEEHVEACDECRRRLDSMLETIASLKNLPDLQAPPSLVPKVMERILRYEKPWARIWRAVTLTWLPLPGRVIGTVSVAVLVAVFFIVLPPGERDKALKLGENKAFFDAAESTNENLLFYAGNEDAKRKSEIEIPAPAKPKDTALDLAETEDRMEGYSYGPRDSAGIAGDKTSDKIPEMEVSLEQADAPGETSEKMGLGFADSVAEPSVDGAEQKQAKADNEKMGMDLSYGTTEEKADRATDELGSLEERLRRLEPTEEISLVMRSQELESTRTAVLKLADKQGWILMHKPETPAPKARASEKSLADETTTNEWGYISGSGAWTTVDLYAYTSSAGSMSFMVPRTEIARAETLLGELAATERVPVEWKSAGVDRDTAVFVEKDAAESRSIYTQSESGAGGDVKARSTLGSASVSTSPGPGESVSQRPVTGTMTRPGREIEAPNRPPAISISGSLPEEAKTSKSKALRSVDQASRLNGGSRQQKGWIILTITLAPPVGASE